MWSSMNKRAPVGLIVVIAVLLAVNAYGFFSVTAVDSLVQYIYPAPEPVAVTNEDGSTVMDNSGLGKAAKAAGELLETLPASIGKSTVYAVCDPTTVTSDDEDDPMSVSCRLEAQQDGVYAVRPGTLYVGRWIYPDEFKYGERVIILDENLAVALFKYAEPLDREVMVQGLAYRVVGITRDRKRVGDHQEYSCYIPLRSLEKSELAMTALCLETLPSRGSGAYNALKQAVTTLSEQGTLISLNKEKQNATMPLRVLAFVTGCWLVLAILRSLNAQAVKRYRAYQEKMKTSYFIRLLPWTAGNVIIMSLGYAACIAALAGLFVMILDPVYTFPEWVPAVLVEPKDVAAVFWNVWQTPATVIEYRSPELLRIRFFKTLLAWSSGGMALTLGALLCRLKKPAKADHSQEQATQQE